MWKTLRRIVALAVLLLFFWGFANLRNAEPSAWENAVERLQFVPAFLGALSGKEWAAVILAGLVATTLIFGRAYCSFLCPLGIMQDAVIRLRALADRARGRQRKEAPRATRRPLPACATLCCRSSSFRFSAAQLSC